MRGLHYPFSRRQRQILPLLARGMCTDEVAQVIGITPNNVRRQLGIMYRALSCNRPALIVFSVEWVRHHAKG